MSVQPTILAGAFTQVEPVLREFVSDFDLLMKRADLAPNDVENTEALISLNSVAELLEMIADEVGDDGLGARLGQMYPADSASVMGYAMMAAPTVQHSLQDVQRYHRIVTPQQRAEFETDGSVGTVTWHLPVDLIRPCTQYITTNLSVMVGRIRVAAGKDWCPAATRFEFERPTNMEAYRSVFGDSIEFESGTTQIEVPREVLDLPMPGSDERLHNLLRELGDYRIGELDSGSDIVDRTQDRIIALLNQGPVTLEVVARDLGQSPRSLQRRLQEEGTSFQVVFEKTRRLLARHYLRTRQHTLTDVTFLLGFSEQSAFTRACKRWFDATPFEMRARLREERHN